MSTPIARPQITPSRRGPRWRRLTGIAVLAAAALSAGSNASSTAQEAKPTPTPCAGTAFTDPAGDATAALTRDNLDLTAGFLRYVTNSAGVNVLTANIQVTDLHTATEAGSYYVSWWLRWNKGGTDQYVRLQLFSDGQTFVDYGTYAGDLATRLGETTGHMFPGRDGIVEIVVPVAELGLDGKRITNPHAIAGFTNSDGLNLYPEVVVDRAPDGQTGGKAFEVVPCAAENTATTPQPTAPPRRPSGTGRARLGVKVIIGRQSARRITKRRSLTIGLRAGERTTALRALLMRGKKVVAAGRLASLRGKGAVRLRLRGKTSKLEAGTYTLRLTARNARGKVASGRVQVRIRR